MTLDGGSPAGPCSRQENVSRSGRFDPDLAGLRESSAMGKFSTDEREECLALWQEVGNLLRRARESK